MDKLGTYQQFRAWYIAVWSPLTTFDGSRIHLAYKAYNNNPTKAVKTILNQRFGRV